MGKKGTKRKTKWRALPLVEEAGGSGNEEEVHDEDQSTTSSVLGQPPSSYKRQPAFYKVADKSYRPTKRFPYDRYLHKEPLVKLESKTFDEEEYTKITTPRQDVLFKKGYFGRKRESSSEEPAHHAEEEDGEEPMMDQIIITNGFVDERGHYLVNGNSYEIYDPYSNTVTVVVGPPPYANGVTQPVLAAVSCQPVPLQPVDWYPPGSDWPSQGSAWTPSYPPEPSPEGAPAPDCDGGVRAVFPPSAYVVPGIVYGESLPYNGVPVPANNPASPVERQVDDGNGDASNKTPTKSTDVNGEMEAEVKPRENIKSEDVTDGSSPKIQNFPSTNDFKTNINQREVNPKENGFTTGDSTTSKQVEKQSHSTQTNSLECSERLQPSSVPEKESHSTQTAPEETFTSNNKDLSNENIPSNNTASELFLSKNKDEFRLTRKYQPNKYPKKFQEDSPKKSYQLHSRFLKESRFKIENTNGSSTKVSYAKKAMTGLENKFEKNYFVSQTTNNKLTNGIVDQTPSTNGIGHQRPPYAEKPGSNGNGQNGFIRPKYEKGSSGGKPSTNDRSNQKDLKCKDRKAQGKITEVDVSPEKKLEDISVEFRSHSEKSSTVSELSSPTELSSGQNTPPEKLIVKKMEQKIANEFNKSFKEKLKEDLTFVSSEERAQEEEKKKEEEVELEAEEEAQATPEKEEAGEELEEKETKRKGKKNKSKPEGEKATKRSKPKKKRKKASGGKSESSVNPNEDFSFLPNFMRQKAQDPIFGPWIDSRDERIPGMGAILAEDQNILKSLGIDQDKMTFSKLPLHSDLMTMFGWGRPKLKIEDYFAPTRIQSDLFTKRNITNMKSTRPEEFFASVIDDPVVEKTEKKKEGPKNGKKDSKSSEEVKPTTKEPSPVPAKKKSPAKTVIEDTGDKEIPRGYKAEHAETENKEIGRLGIVEAVNTWLQEQGANSGNVLSVSSSTPKEPAPTAEKDEAGPKNAESNPIRAPSVDGPEERRPTAEFLDGGGRIRVANVITDGFKHLDQEFLSKKKTGRKGRMYRSSSWDTKLSDIKMKKRFKFLTDSASFCQDLISDVRNGLPAKSEYATEELCDPRQSVSKYYTLAPSGGRKSALPESDSENEVFDALEYKFLTKENLAKRDAEGKVSGGAGNVSVTDSGVHSDLESSEDAVNDHLKETPCKLQ